MPKFDLAAAKQIKNALGEILEVKSRGISWEKTVPLPTGGEITLATIDGNSYRIHTFRESGTFECFAPVEVEYFLVGGGGTGTAAKSDASRGGGAGGRVKHNLDGGLLPLSVGAYPVVVAAGGTGSGGNGRSSTFAGIEAEGGGGASAGTGGNQLGAGGFLGGLTGGGTISGGGGAGAGGDGQAGAAGGSGGPGLLMNPDGFPRVFGIGGNGNSVGTGRDQDPPDKNNRGHGTPGRRVSGSITSYPGGSGVVIIRYPYS